MKATPAHPVLRDIHLLFRGGAAGNLTDGELLDRFVASGDEAAFEVLVHRLGPMVLGVCRRLLRDRHDAEDAFQATFLVLARRASAIDPPSRVGPWLHGVALRVAMRARSTRARRRLREAGASNPPDRASESKLERDDLLPLLDGELGRLPEKYRAPIVLCHLEGKPYKEAARQLGLREGTLSGRLTRGRALLAARLSRRGAATSVGAIAVLLTREASARVPMPLAASAVGAAFANRGPAWAALAVSAEVAALTRGTLRTMLMTKLRVASVALATVGIIGVGVASGGRDDPARTPPAEKVADRVAKDGRRPDGPADPAADPVKRVVDTTTRFERVEAFKIGGDLFVNVAPPGADRLILEKVAGAGRPEDGWGRVGESRADVVTVRGDVVTTTVADAGPESSGPGRADPAMHEPGLNVEYRSIDAPDDAIHARRVYLYIVGRLPTREEVASYVGDRSPDRDAALVEKLAGDPLFLRQAKESLKLRLGASMPPAAKPVRFTIDGATLDRVDVENGDRIDVHLADGPDYVPTDPAKAHPTPGSRDGRPSTNVVAPVTRLQALPVAADAMVHIDLEHGAVATGPSEPMLKSLRPGMRLSLEVVAAGNGLIVKGIKTRLANEKDGASAADPFPFYYPGVKPGSTPSRR